MARFVNPVNGVVVDTDDDTASRLGWPPAIAESRKEAIAPAQSAKKADWVDYAVSQGADRDTSVASTKDDLVELYG